LYVGAVADPDLQIREEGGHPDPEIRGEPGPPGPSSGSTTD